VKEIIKNVEKMFSLDCDDLGHYILSAMCGGVGMYEVSILLDAEEVERFRIEGNAFIEELAYDVVRNTSKYKDRILR
jgi:hypothetical protein